MTTCLGSGSSFGLLCVSLVNVYLFLCVCFFIFCSEGWNWDLIMLIPDRCLFIHFSPSVFNPVYEIYRWYIVFVFHYRCFCINVLCQRFLKKKTIFMILKFGINVGMTSCIV